MNIYEKTAIVIPHLNETKKNIDMTINSVKQDIPDAHIILIEDLNQDGTSRTRHRGVLEAIKLNKEYVITIDAHMQFRNKALSKMVEHLALNTKDVLCINCYHNPTCTFDNNKYFGAMFTEFAKNNSEHVSLAGQWATELENKENKQNCLMGACYGFTTEFYNYMLQPWQINKGWGQDEELLSLCTHFFGGKIVHLDLDSAHLYRTHGRNTNKEQEVRQWTNRYNLIDLIPDDVKRQELLNHMMKTPRLNLLLPKIFNNRKDIMEHINKIKAKIKDIHGDNLDNVTKDFFSKCRQETKSVTLHSLSEDCYKCSDCGTVNKYFKLNNGAKQKIRCVNCGFYELS